MGLSDFEEVDIIKIFILFLNEDIKSKEYYYYIDFEVKRYLSDYKIFFILFIKLDRLIIVLNLVK